MSDEKFLEGKVALITGASGGFGRAMAIKFASKGANLALNDVNLEGLEETRDIVLKDHKVDVLLVKADISNSKEVEEMAKKILEKFDNVFLIVNNAGIDGGLYSLLKIKEAAFDKVMGVNVKGTWNVTKAFFRKIKRQRQFSPVRAKIINIASCAGTPNGLNPMLGVYSTSKAAIIAMTKLMALELGSSDITVNAISPGMFITPIYKNDPKLMRQLLESKNLKLPIDKLGEADWVADLALFIASPAADYITGQNFVIDGGMTLSINKFQ